MIIAYPKEEFKGISIKWRVGKPLGVKPVKLAGRVKIKIKRKPKKWIETAKKPKPAIQPKYRVIPMRFAPFVRPKPKPKPSPPPPPFILPKEEEEIPVPPKPKEVKAPPISPKPTKPVRPIISTKPTKPEAPKLVKPIIPAKPKIEVKKPRKFVFPVTKPKPEEVYPTAPTVPTAPIAPTVEQPPIPEKVSPVVTEKATIWEQMEKFFKEPFILLLLLIIGLKLLTGREEERIILIPTRHKERKLEKEI